MTGMLMVPPGLLWTRPQALAGVPCLGLVRLLWNRGLKVLEEDAVEVRRTAALELLPQ